MAGMVIIEVILLRVSIFDAYDESSPNFVEKRIVVTAQGQAVETKFTRIRLVGNGKNR